MAYYIEYIFLENVIVNYIIIYELTIFVKCKVNKISFIIGILLLSCYSTAIYFFKEEGIINRFTKILVVFFCIYIIFLPKEVVKYIKICIYYFLLSFMFVGIVIALTLFFNLEISNIVIKIIAYIISSLILYIFNKYLWKMWKSRIKKEDLIYNIKIKDIIIKAFVDTGNNVHDFIKNLDVIFVEEKYKNELKEKSLINKKEKLNIKTISGDEYVEGYIVENVEIRKKNKNICVLKKVVLVFVDRELKNGEYNALISYETYIEKLKGVALC